MPEPIQIQPLITKQRESVARRLAYRSGTAFLNLAVVILVGSLVVAGGLFLYARALDRSQAQWIVQVKGQEEDLAEGTLSLIDTSNALNAARELVTGHVFASNALVLLEQLTLPRVQYKGFTFQREETRIELNAIAASYRMVSEQVQTFESHPQVARVDFGGLAVGSEGFVNFKLTVVFKPSLIQGALQ